MDENPPKGGNLGSKKMTNFLEEVIITTRAGLMAFAAIGASAAVVLLWTFPLKERFSFYVLAIMYMLLAAYMKNVDKKVFKKKREIAKTEEKRKV